MPTTFFLKAIVFTCLEKSWEKLALDGWLPMTCCLQIFCLCSTHFISWSLNNKEVNERLKETLLFLNNMSVTFHFQIISINISFLMTELSVDMFPSQCLSFLQCCLNNQRPKTRAALTTKVWSYVSVWSGSRMYYGSL